MKAVHDSIESPFAIGEDMALYGTFTGDATLESGVRFILHGTIAGRIYNKGGRVEIFGMAGAVENLSRHAETIIDPGAHVRGGRPRREGRPHA
ncbi:hypothetical protein [Novosphingobium clariflavum]|uniref:Polymer-forming cytoskeletal protein n=1 Tax=Novosphingobium clariflavum TaxID=2029884 RepID=A0ABV6SHN1_9SPHN|nr:hypothetical protein [Novosphingobium clariflavum]